MNKRLKEIDIVRGLTIFLVVLGHSGFNSSSGILPDMLRDFRMPLFFIVSGYLFSTSKYLNDGNKLINDKFRSLIIPYISFAVVGSIIWYFSLIHNDKSINLFEPLIRIWEGKAIKNPPIWFLLVLFFSFIIFKIILSLTKKHSFFIQLVSFVLIGYLGYFISKLTKLPMSFDIALVAVFFMFIGLKLKEKKILFNHKSMIFLSFISIFLFFISSYFNIPGDMNNRIYGSLLLFYTAGISGSILTLFLTKYILSRSNVIYYLFSYLGRESIIILGFHFSIGIYLIRYFEKSQDFSLSYISTTIISISLSLGLGVIINRIPLLKFLFKGIPLKRNDLKNNQKVTFELKN